MIIDIHYHLFDSPYLSPGMWDDLARLCVTFSPPDQPISMEEAKEKMIPRMLDPTGEATVRNMDEWGIDKAAVLAVDNGLLHGEGQVGIEGQNRAVADAAKRFPDRLIAFMSVDPRRPEALELVDRCVNDFGMKGLKCHPDAGWYPDDEAYYPFWDKIREFRLPVLTHTGPLQPPSVNECVHPARLDKLARDFPELTFIAAHMAFGWYKELIEVARKRDNLMVDIAAWQITAHESYGKFAHVLRRVMDAFGAERVLFGTDAPTFSFFYSEREWVKAVQDLVHRAPEGYVFTPEEIEAVMHGNAARILGL